MTALLLFAGLSPFTCGVGREANSHRRPAKCAVTSRLVVRNSAGSREPSGGGGGGGDGPEAGPSTARGFGVPGTSERRVVVHTQAMSPQQKRTWRQQRKAEPKWTTDDLDNEERLQKVLARLGVASRRGCEEMISAGRVTVNGKAVTQLGTKVNAARDKLVVDGESVTSTSSRRSSAIRWVVVHKPRGYVSTVTDTRGRRSVVDLVPNGSKMGLVPVGRLDVGSTGLILLTNELSMCHLLTHPSYSHEKRYLVHIRGPRVRHAHLNRLRTGVELPAEQGTTGGRTGTGGAMRRYLSPAKRERTLPCEVELFSYENSVSVVGIVLREGMKRQIRRMVAAVGAGEVVKLHRVSFGCVELGALRYGQWRDLEKDEVRRLRTTARRAVIGEAQQGIRR